MKVLVACEFSGVVRDAFNRLGHEAYSCDILPGQGWLKDYRHIQGYIERVFDTKPYKNWKWDLMIAHPPCTYLTVANSRNFQRYASEQEAAIKFCEWLWKLPVDEICIENPVGVLSTKSILGKPSQIIQPYEFGESASKKTCLWLKNLPKLKPTKRITGRFVEYDDGRIFERFNNQTDSGQNKLAPSESRASDRAITYKGIAEAMAEQWGNP